MNIASRPLIVISLAASLAACATVDPTRDTVEINRLLTDRGAPALGWEANGTAGDDAQVQGWLAQPMSADLAVRMAMVVSTSTLRPNFFL